MLTSGAHRVDTAKVAALLGVAGAAPGHPGVRPGRDRPADRRGRPGRAPARRCARWSTSRSPTTTWSGRPAGSRTRSSRRRTTSWSGSPAAPRPRSAERSAAGSTYAHAHARGRCRSWSRCTCGGCRGARCPRRCCGWPSTGGGAADGRACGSPSCSAPGDGRHVHASATPTRAGGGCWRRWADRAVGAGVRAVARSAARWRRLAEETWRVELRPLAAAGGGPGGSRSGRRAGGRVGGAGGGADPGPAAAGRGRRRSGGRSRRSPPTWRGRPGLRLAVGIGEAPVGLQGTFSLWESAAALRDFAYAGAAHRAVVAAHGAASGGTRRSCSPASRSRRADGSVDGRDPLA